MKRFQIFSADTLVGSSQLEKGDPPMGAAFGVFVPNQDYARIQPHCREMQGGKGFSNLSVQIGGKKIECLSVDIVDFSHDLGPNGIEVHAVGIPYPLYEELFPGRHADYVEIMKMKPISWIEPVRGYVFAARKAYRWKALFIFGVLGALSMAAAFFLPYKFGIWMLSIGMFIFFPTPVMILGAAHTVLFKRAKVTLNRSQILILRNRKEVSYPYSVIKQIGYEDGGELQIPVLSIFLKDGSRPRSILCAEGISLSEIKGAVPASIPIRSDLRDEDYGF
jgi:hypothetical protein